ncbi:MAG: TetR/AcrR family transcriptional regulator [Pseudomonadota bacterium]
MRNNRDLKRQALKDRLIAAAEALIHENGLRGLKARDITAKAGCALGALYNAVEDLDELVTLVNSRSLARLGQALHDAVPAHATPQQTMHALAQGYVQFALDNTNLWSAIFNHRPANGAEIPEWHQQEYAVLIQEIIIPLAQMRPDLASDPLRLRAQTLFASVHGVVQLSIHGRYVGTPPDALADEVAALVDAMTRGIHLIQANEG